MLDLVGIGTLNIDYIATPERLSRIPSHRVKEGVAKFVHGHEIPVSEKVINDLLEEWSEADLHINLGGSAFNTVRAMRALDSSLRLGFVGTMGESRESGITFSDWFNRNTDVNTKWIRYMPDKRSGVCVSLMEKGERSLLTNDGNAPISGFLHSHFEEVAEYLSMSKIVHVTSFYNDTTAAPEIARLLIEAKKRAKKHKKLLSISFDPGPNWAEALPDGVEKILNISDYVFVNENEFRDLGLKEPDELACAKKILKRFPNEMLLLLVKQYNAVSTFCRVKKKIFKKDYPYSAIAKYDIVDATGAGDVFSAGVLAAALTDNLDTSDGVELGIRMARKKLQSVGDSAFGDFPSILSDLLDKPEELVKTVSVSPESAIFISYSHTHAEWLQRLKVHLKPFERDSVIHIWDDTKIRTGQEWKAEIESALKRTKVAVLLVSADFLASDFIANNELPPLLSSAENNGTVIMPIIIKPCGFQRFDSLSRFQAVNPPSKTLVELNEGERERFFLKLTEDILNELS